MNWSTSWKRSLTDILERKKLIIDTDCGSDDAMAIAMALRDERYEILAFTAVAGNVDRYRFSGKEPNCAVCSALKPEVFKEYIFCTLGA